MKILDDLVSTINLKAEARDVRQGPFQTAVLTRNCGLASTPHDNADHQKQAPVKDAGNLIWRGTGAMVHMAHSSNPLEAAIGMATINSLLDIDKRRCLEINASELIAEKGKGKKVQRNQVAHQAAHQGALRKRSGNW